MKRVLTAAAGVPLVLAVTLWSPNWAFALFVALFGLLALDEYLTLRATPRVGRPGFWVLPCGAALTVSFLASSLWTLAVFLLAAILSVATGLRSASSAIAWRRSRDTLTGLLYTCFLLGFLLRLSRTAVIVLLGIVWISDTAAYYGGRRWGRRRLAPRISPNKTIEGAVAGTLASVIFGAVVGGEVMGLRYGTLALIALVTTIAGQAGDLFESAIKRSAGVKDSSDRLPGHGGFLDRLDSLLFAAPVFYLMLLWIS